MSAFNLSTMENIIFNGVDLDKVIYNGTVVWEKVIPIEDVALIPTMTSNSAPWGAAAGSTQFGSSQTYWKAFDTLGKTHWLSKNLSNQTNVQNAYLEYTFGNSNAPTYSSTYLDADYVTMVNNAPVPIYYNINKIVFTPAVASSTDNFKNGYAATIYIHFYKDSTSTLVKTISYPLTAAQMKNREEITIDNIGVEKANLIRIQFSSRTRDGASSTSAHYISMSKFQLYGYNANYKNFDGTVWKYTDVNNYKQTGNLLHNNHWVQISRSSKALTETSRYDIVGCYHKSTSSSSSYTLKCLRLGDGTYIFNKQDLLNKGFTSIYFDSWVSFWGDVDSGASIHIFDASLTTNTYLTYGNIQRTSRASVENKFSIPISELYNTFIIGLNLASDSDQDNPAEYAGMYFKEISFK